MHMIEFDEAKAILNFQTHGIHFADVEPVFYDKRAIKNRSDRMTAWGTMEERYITTGCDSLGRIVTVAWAPRGGRYRLISARKARDEEKEDYEQE